MEILEAFDLTGTLRGAAELAGCDHKTVAHWVRARDEAGGGLPVSVRPRPRVDGFAEKIEEWVSARAARSAPMSAHERLVAMGYQGSERTTRRAVAEAKRRWRAEHGRRTRPWIVEPGLWMQWDYGDGPTVAGRRTVLFCAWLAWSRFRVVIALWDKTMPSVVMALDRALRAFGGAPTYALTDNEKTVSVDHVCGIAVRNPQIVAVGAPLRADDRDVRAGGPESKGGSEATVRIAKADLVPTEHNLARDYASFAELEQACGEFCERVNAREHRITRRAPAVMLGEERARLHRLPALPHTVCFGQTRKVSWQSTISVGGALYSVPSTLVDERVWARVDGSELVIVHADSADGPREVARHALTTPGRPSIHDEHYPPRPAGALERKPRAGSRDERAFLAIGAGRRAVADRRRRGGRDEGAAQARRGRRAGQAARRGGGRRGAARRRGRRIASATATWRRSSSTATARDRVPRRAPTRSARCSAPRAPGRASAHDRDHARPPALPAEVDRLLRRLRMPYVRRAAPEVIATAASQRWEPAEVLRVLLAEEAAGRDQATIRMRRRASGLPAGKTFDAWDPAASPIPAATQQSLRTLEWLGRAENLCVCGPSGTGKSHLAEALGHLAIDHGKTVAWHTLESLALLLRRHRADDTVAKAIGRLIRADLIVIDDIGMLPVAPDAAEALFRVVDAAYEKRSIALTSNIHPAGFDELMPKTLAAATVDRLLHHAHVLLTDGTDSYRLAQATAGKGVRPLT